MRVHILFFIIVQSKFRSTASSTTDETVRLDQLLEAAGAHIATAGAEDSGVRLKILLMAADIPKERTG